MINNVLYILNLKEIDENLSEFLHLSFTNKCIDIKHNHFHLLIYCGQTFEIIHN